MSETKRHAKKLKKYAKKLQRKAHKLLTIEEHKRRAAVYRIAAEEWSLSRMRWLGLDRWEGDLECGMCVAVASALEKSECRPFDSVDWYSSETRVFRGELTREVGRLDRFSTRMNGSMVRGPDPDRVLIRGDILTRAAEYHEACVRAGKTL